MRMLWSFNKLCDKEAQDVFDNRGSKLFSSDVGKAVEGKRHLELVAASQVSLDSLEDEATKLAGLAQQDRDVQVPLS